MRINERPVVLITGAARRVGRVIARALHAAGYDLALHYRQSAGEAQSLAAELEARREKSTLLLAGDLLATAEIPKLILRLVQHFGRLDGVVNNASAFYPTAIGDTTEQQWDELFGSNAKAPFFLAQAAAPHLRKARGAIVNLVDIYAERPLARHPVYCMAKAAIAMMTQALALELGPEVRVNGVAPGAVLWPDSGKAYTEQQKLIGTTPMKRTGTPEEVAAAILFLLRDGSFVNGEILRVDGGRAIAM